MLTNMAIPSPYNSYKGIGDLMKRPVREDTASSVCFHTFNPTSLCLPHFFNPTSFPSSFFKQLSIQYHFNLFFFARLPCHTGNVVQKSHANRYSIWAWNEEAVCLYDARWKDWICWSVVHDRWCTSMSGTVVIHLNSDLKLDSCGGGITLGAKCSFVPGVMLPALLGYTVSGRYTLELRLGKWGRTAIYVWYGIWYGSSCHINFYLTPIF